MDDFAHSHLELDEAKNPFDLKVLVLYAVARFRGLIVSLGILGALLGLVAGAAQPNVYASQTKFRFEPSARQMIREEGAFGVDSGDVRVNGRNAMNEELELLKDPAIYDRVVEQIGAREILRVADPRSGDDESTSMPVRFMHSLQAGLITLKGQADPFPDGETPDARVAAYERLKANVSITNTRNTGLINIKYTDSSPAKAKKILDALTDEMRQRHLATFSTVEDLETLKQNKRDAFQDAKDKRQQLLEFKDQCGFHDLDNDLRAANTEIMESERELASLDKKRGGLLGRIRSFKADLGLSVNLTDAEREKLAETGVGAAPPGHIFNPVYRDLREQLATKEKELRDSTIVFSDADPDSFPGRKQRELRLLIDSLSDSLEATDLYVPESQGLLGGDLSDSYADTRNELILAKAELEDVISSIKFTRERIDKVKASRRAMEECEADYRKQAADLEMAQAKVDSLAKAERQLTGLAYMDAEGRSELSIFRPSRLARDKEGPQRSKPLIMGLFGGMALGAGIAILRQLLDRRVRYQETIENSIGLRVLCVVPDLSNQPGFRAKKGAA